MLFILTNALFMIKSNQFLNGKLMEAAPAHPSTGNPKLHS